MTDAEKNLMQFLEDCFNHFSTLPKTRGDGYHENDMVDFTFHIHALQNLVSARTGLREFWK